MGQIAPERDRERDRDGVFEVQKEQNCKVRKKLLLFFKKKLGILEWRTQSPNIAARTRWSLMVWGPISVKVAVLLTDGLLCFS